MDDSRLVGWLLKHELIALPEDRLMELVAALAASGGGQRTDSRADDCPGDADGSGEDEAVFICGNHRLLGEAAPRRGSRSDLWRSMAGRRGERAT
ncbi:MAG: hypothetical protein R3B96_21185 [Pirellulaceae bacterium]